VTRAGSASNVAPGRGGPGSASLGPTVAGRGLPPAGPQRARRSIIPQLDDRDLDTPDVMRDLGRDLVAARSKRP
jgi:hypothetical protein